MNKNDYVNWEFWIQQCSLIDNLADIKREESKQALRSLRSEFGEDFLKNAFDKWHPICSYLVNTAPWTREWLIWFVDSLQELKNQDKYNDLLKRLKDKEKFAEGLSVLKVVCNLCSAGFKINLDPEIYIDGKPKIPDLGVINIETGEEGFVEVSMQGISDIQKRADETMDRITLPILMHIPTLSYSGRIHKSLATRHLAEIVKKVDSLIETVKRDNRFQELIIDDVIELAVTQEKNIEAIEKWVFDRGLKVNELQGPAFKVDEVQRTKVKINKERQQLPSGHSNIIVIENSALFFRVKDFKGVMNELEEWVYDYPNVLALIVTGEDWIFGQEDEKISKGQHIYSRRTHSGFLQSQSIILLNRFCGVNASSNYIQKIYKAFQ